LSLLMVWYYAAFGLGSYKTSRQLTCFNLSRLLFN